MKLLIAGLLGILAVVGGIGIGLGALAYSIWMIVLMVKGTVAVTFWAILKVVACWFFGPLCGWLWGLLCGAIAAAIADQS